MRTVLTAICAFTILAWSWLFAMFLVLRHPGFEWRAALTLSVIIISALTLAFVRSAPHHGAQHAIIIVALGAVLLLCVGAWAIETNRDEGYLDVIGIALIVQSVLTLALVRRSVWRSSSKEIRRLS